MDLKAKLVKVFGNSNKKIIMGGVFLLGLLLILFPSVSQKEESQIGDTAVSLTDEEYCTALENKVKSIVTAITGDSDCLVAITLENSKEYVYADQNKIDTDLTDEGEGGTTKESVKKEQEYIIVKEKDGSQSALTVTEKNPTVMGVAIVSSGITDTAKEQITESVTALLGITSRRISINSKQNNY